MHKLHLVEVRWEDISCQAGWDSEENVRKAEPIACITVGWRMESTAKKLVLVSSRSDNGTYGDRNTIPKGCIKSIRRIE